MAEFRIYAADVVTGVVKTQDLALEEWSYTNTLNRPGSLSASMPLRHPDCTEEVLDAWRTAIYVARDGRIEFGGILAPPTLGVGANQLSIDVFGWSGYFDRRVIRKDYAPVGVDQFAIFKQLVDDAQDTGTFGTGYDLDIDVTWSALSGVLRDRPDDYLVPKSKNLGEALRQLAALENGFDFVFEFIINAATDRIDKTIRLYYPRKGRDTNYVFEYEEGFETNIIQRGFADRVEMAWTGDGWGSGTDKTRLRAPYLYAPRRGVYPPYEDSPAWSSVIDQAVLNENTASWFRRHQTPLRVPDLLVDPDSYPMWGDWDIGDTVLVRIADGYGSTTPIVGDRYRITGTNVSQRGDHRIVLGDLLGPGGESAG